VSTSSDGHVVSLGVDVSAYGKLHLNEQDSPDLSGEVQVPIAPNAGAVTRQSAAAIGNSDNASMAQLTNSATSMPRDMLGEHTGEPDLMQAKKDNELQSSPAPQ
jgi:hypothetical protein